MEVALAVSIAMIISAWAIVNTRGMVLKQKGHAVAIALFKEIQALPPLAMKTDRTFFVRFDPSGTDKYRVFMDKDGDGALTISTDSLITSFNKPELEIAFPDPLPNDPIAMTGVSLSAVVDGEWKDSSNTVIISNDDLNTINPGTLYLKNPQLPKQGYCIYLAPNTRTFKLIFWNGSSWITM